MEELMHAKNESSVTRRSLLLSTTLLVATIALAAFIAWLVYLLVNGSGTLAASIAAVFISIAGAGIAFRQQKLSHFVMPLTSSSKLWDRQNDLDKLFVSQPALIREFMARAQQSSSYFYSSETEKNDLYYQLKGLTYLHLNFFEEIFLTSNALPQVSVQFEGQQWQAFMFLKMRHSLLKEVFINEQGSTYTGRFVDFLNQNRQHWDMPTYSRDASVAIPSNAAPKPIAEA
jgi:hypothetical protein